MRYLLLVIFLVGCASPRVWIISQDDVGGVIGYQNYDPSTDKGIRIKQLLQCVDHRMTSNPIKQGYSAPTMYHAYSNGYGLTTVYPLDGGTYEWAEYHYRCNSRYTGSKPQSFEGCKLNCVYMKNKGELASFMTVEECVTRMCTN